jgi:hypothetical protein
MSNNLPMSQEIPWKRITIETIAIVGSILLAFAIDAAWSARQTQADERTALEGLYSDFMATREQMNVTMEEHRARSQGYHWLQTATDNEIRGLSPEAATSLYRDLYAPITVDVSRGTLDGLIGAGELGLIKSPALRQILVDFQTYHDDLEEERSMMRAASYEFQAATIALGGPWTAHSEEVRSSTTLPELQPVGPADLVALRETRHIWGLAGMSYYWSAIYLQQLQRLATAVDDILAILQQELGSA